MFASLAVPLYAFATIGLWLLARPRGDVRWKLACTSALVAASLAFAVDQAISHVWERPRPFATHATYLLSAPSPDPSFPSDHAAAAFAIAFAVLAFSRRAGVGFLITATLIGVSRIAVGLHYPSDVLAGMLVGWSAALLVTTLAGSLVARVVTSASRVTDPLLAPVWDGVARRVPARRRPPREPDRPDVGRA